MNDQESWYALQFADGTYFSCRVWNGICYATDDIHKAKQFRSRREADQAKDGVRGVDGKIIPCKVADVPVWAMAF